MNTITRLTVALEAANSLLFDINSFDEERAAAMETLMEELETIRKCEGLLDVKE